MSAKCTRSASAIGKFYAEQTSKSRDVYRVGWQQDESVKIMAAVKDRTTRKDGAEYWSRRRIQAQPTGVTRRHNLIDRAPSDAQRGERCLDVTHNPY